MQKSEMFRFFFGEIPKENFWKTPSLFWSEVYNDWSLEKRLPLGVGAGVRARKKPALGCLARREECVCFN